MADAAQTGSITSIQGQKENPHLRQLMSLKDGGIASRKLY